MDRPNGISPSQFAKIMTSGRGKNEIFGKTAESYAEEVVCRIMGFPLENYVSEAMQFGIDCEPLAIKEYESVKFTEVDYTKDRVLHPKYEYISGEPDGLVGEDGILEIKCPNPTNHFKNLLNGEQISQYMYQIQGYLWLTDRQWCDFCSFRPDYPEKYRLSVNRVVRDQDMIDSLEQRCVLFWNELVLPKLEQVRNL
jgi:predicted phage-related endonuclease